MSRDDSVKFTPESRSDWRSWLEKNHASATELWLVFRKKHTRKPNLSYNDAVEEAVCFGWIDGIKRSIDKDRYMHRFSPRKADSQWSESNKKRVQRMLEAGLMTPAGQKTIDVAKKNGNWALASSARPQFDMPPAFRQRLSRNKKAAVFFASLAPSYQRQYVDWIASAKRSDTRDRRLEESIALLSSGKKLGMR